MCQSVNIENVQVIAECGSKKRGSYYFPFHYIFPLMLEDDCSKEHLLEYLLMNYIIADSFQ